LLDSIKSPNTKIPLHPSWLEEEATEEAYSTKFKFSVVSKRKVEEFLTQQRTDVNEIEGVLVIPQLWGPMRILCLVTQPFRADESGLKP
jgi:hypothetical protein